MCNYVKRSCSGRISIPPIRADQKQSGEFSSNRREARLILKRNCEEDPVLHELYCELVRTQEINQGRHEKHLPIVRFNKNAMLKLQRIAEREKRRKHDRSFHEIQKNKLTKE